MKPASRLLKSIQGHALTREERCVKSQELAEDLLTSANHFRRPKEKKREKQVARLVGDQEGKALFTALTDQCFRSVSERRTMDQLLFLLQSRGSIRFLSPLQQLQKKLLELGGARFPKFFVKAIKMTLQRHFEPFLLPTNEHQKQQFLQQCRNEGTRVNYNYLGEAVLGEKEAETRLSVYERVLRDSSIDYISVKISSLCSQINVLDFEGSVNKVAEALRKLYRCAKQFPSPKFVGLDMEEYKDLELTVAVFKKVLSEEEFLHMPAGIVLQSYLPDSFLYQKELTDFAKKRALRGGHPLKLRIVKGANLAMERVESSLRNWPQAPYLEKVQADANFKRMLEYGMQNGHAKVLHIGVGSHNLLDIAYGLLLRAENNYSQEVTFEMLKGMAPSLQKALLELNCPLILYCPEADPKNFNYAVSYLMRRLEENTAPENFLSHAFDLSATSASWFEQKKQFVEACELISQISETSRRKGRGEGWNEPDTDFTAAPRRQKLQSALQAYQPKEVRLLDASSALERLARAKSAEKAWQKTRPEERALLLSKIAQILRDSRAEMTALLVFEGSKIAAEADTEISEAIDLATFYSANFLKLAKNPEIELSTKGTILVAPPWNFPLSIAISGILAALVTGNCVLFKPAPEAVKIGHFIAKLLHHVGVSEEVFHFVPCPDDPVGSLLIQDARVNAVILTGSNTTAHALLRLRPSLDLSAETGGKNTLIVSSLCDRDLAIKDIVHSAFGHAGQKCSALSLALLHHELYDDPRFLEQLADAAKSLQVGPAFDLSTKIPPLIREPGESLLRGLTTLEEGESWLLKPQQKPGSPLLWSPGIKLGVREGSFTHQTELFGPVLGLMRADHLEHAVRLASSTPYGLTAGLHSLDAREQAYWKEHIVAGNLYINRSITGALVQRQPFGGCKASSYGSGAKVGGPNSLINCVRIHLKKPPEESCFLPPFLIPLIQRLSLFSLSDQAISLIKKNLQSYVYYDRILKEPVDVSQVLGQQNQFFHVPLEGMTLRIQSEDKPQDVLSAIGALLISKTPFEISIAPHAPAYEKIPSLLCTIETDEAFAKSLHQRTRLLSSPSALLFQAAAEKYLFLDHAPLLGHGRFEMLHYLREVAISYDYHRYGNLSASLSMS